MTEQQSDFELRVPTVSDLSVINDLILRSKAIWGYDDAFMKACEQELAVDGDLLHQHSFMAAVEDHQMIAVAEVSLDGKTAHLEKLFVDPERLKTGSGRRLFSWALDTAKAGGATKMVIEADPDAEPFYLKMGAHRVGLVPSGSIPGRMLPELELSL